MSRLPGPAEQVWLDEIKQAAEAFQQAKQERDDLVRRAAAAGCDRTQIAAAVGLSRGRVYQILDGK